MGTNLYIQFVEDGRSNAAAGNGERLPLFSTKCHYFFPMHAASRMPKQRIYRTQNTCSVTGPQIAVDRGCPGQLKDLFALIRGFQLLQHLDNKPDRPFGRTAVQGQSNGRCFKNLFPGSYKVSSSKVLLDTMPQSN